MSSSFDADSDELPPLDMGGGPPAAAPAPVASTGAQSSHSSASDSGGSNAFPSVSPPLSSPSPQPPYPTVTVGACAASPGSSTGQNPSSSPSPATHASRPTPVQYSSRLVKSRTASGAKMINGRVLMHALGEGATADVSLCVDPVTGEHFALKRMSKRALMKQKEYAPGPLGRPRVTTGLDKVRREIALLAQAWHRNVLVLEGVIDDPEEDALIMVLEYASQGQVMQFDGKERRYRNHIFAKGSAQGTAAATGTTASAVAAASSSSGPASSVSPIAAAAWSPASDATSSSSSSAADTSLQPLVHDPPIPEHILRKILHDVLNGIEYLHSLRICHRDIKPENLLLSSDGAVKLCDLGVARQFAPSESELISETHGTYHFFSPEMCTGEKYSPFVSDLWSLGVTLYILSTGGVVPFLSADDNPQELFSSIAAHSRGSLRWPRDFPSPALRDLVDRIMDPSPATRLSIEQMREHAWMRAEGEPASPLEHDMRSLEIASPILVPTTE